MGLGGDCFRTWSVADGCIEWRANNGNVVVLIGLDKTLDWLQVGEAGNAGEGPLDSLYVRNSSNLISWLV